MKDLAFYSAVLRQVEEEHTAAIERAGGPFDASYNPPPVLLGEEQKNAADEFAGPPPEAPQPEKDERSVEEKSEAEQEEAGIVEAPDAPDATEAAPPTS